MCKDLPTISIITPTLNSARTLPAYFEAILTQDYPKDAVEIIIADGGSTDSTCEIACSFGARVVPNALRTGEAGKAAALKHARNELVFLIDSDNIIVGPDWLRRMVAPFCDALVVGAEPIRFIANHDDTIIDRYCAIIGANDPLCIFIGNYDRFSAITGRWTDMPIDTRQHSGSVAFSLKQRALPTIGANGTAYRRSALEGLIGDYLMDIDVPHMLAREEAGWEFAKVDVGIRHLFCSDTRAFVRKQTRRIRDFFSARRNRLRREYPWLSLGVMGVARFTIYSVTVAPLVYQSAKAYLRTKDRAAFFHPVACWLTLYVYAVNFLFFRGRELSRRDWRQ